MHTLHTLIFRLFVRCKLCTLRCAHCAIQLAIHFVWLISCHKGQLQCRLFKTCVTLPLGGWVLQRQCALWIGDLNFCTWWTVAIWAFQTASAKPPKRCHCARCAGFLPSWVLGHQLLINIIWCHASLPPPYKQWKRLWWTTVTILLFKPIAIGKFCLGSILSKLGYRQSDVTIANSLK